MFELKYFLGFQGRFEDKRDLDNISTRKEMHPPECFTMPNNNLKKFKTFEKQKRFKCNGFQTCKKSGYPKIEKNFKVCVPFLVPSKSTVQERPSSEENVHLKSLISTKKPILKKRNFEEASLIDKIKLNKSPLFRTKTNHFPEKIIYNVVLRYKQENLKYAEKLNLKLLDVLCFLQKKTKDQVQIDLKKIQTEPKLSTKGIHLTSLKAVEEQEQFQKLLRNSFLKQKNKLFKEQLEGFFEKILSMIEEREVEYTEHNLLSLANLQIAIEPGEFERLSFELKLKFICFLYAKFVDHSSLSSLFYEFYEDVDISQPEEALFSKTRYIFALILIFRPQSEFSKYFQNIVLKLFPMTGSHEQIKKNGYNFKNIHNFLKKILLFMLSLLQIMQGYLSVKLQSLPKNAYTAKLAKLIHKFPQLSPLENKLNLDPRLKGLSLEQLVTQFKISDFQTFLLLTKIPIHRYQKVVNIVYKSKRIQFIMTREEQSNILCGRPKTKSHLLKFGMNFVRNEIYKKFDKKLMKNFLHFSKAELKNLFFDQFFGGERIAYNFIDKLMFSEKNRKYMLEKTN